MENKKDGPIIIRRDIFDPQRGVSFFLRLHRHLPDDICGGLPIGYCYYREDGRAINSQNDYVDKLQQDPDFLRMEAEVEEAVSNGKSLYTPPPKGE